MDPIWLHDYMRKGRLSLCTDWGIRPKQNAESREVDLGENFSSRVNASKWGKLPGGSKGQQNGETASNEFQLEYCKVTDVGGSVLQVVYFSSYY